MIANAARAVPMRIAFARALRRMSQTIVAFNFRIMREFKSASMSGFLDPNILLF